MDEPTTETPMPPAIAAAIVSAQREVHGAAHDSKNTHHSYNYTSSEALIRDARRALNSAGAAVVSLGWRSFQRIEGGGFWHEEQFVVVHESGETWTPRPVALPAIEIKGKPLDKAILGTDTTLHGYFLRALLQIDRPDVAEDISARDDRGYDPQVVLAAAKPAPDVAKITAEARTFLLGRLAEGSDPERLVVAGLKRLGPLGVTEETIRSWLPVERPAEEPAEKPVFVDLAILAALAGADSPEALVGVARTFAAELRALDPKIVGAALAEHAERLSVDVAELDAAMEET